MTTAQRQAMETLWPRFGIEPKNELINFVDVFGRDAPRILEIGFGSGASLVEMAANHPENNYLGIEVYRTGVGSLLMKIQTLNLTNIRVICADAIEVLTHQIPDASLDAVYLFFPDPWPKKRHHKRRLVQATFADLIKQKLKIGGQFHMATDWEHYAVHMMEIMSQAPGFTNIAGPEKFSPKPDERPLTKFELRGKEKGHGVWDLIFVRTA